MEASEAYCLAREEWKKVEEEAQDILASEKQKLKEAKTLREQRRKEGVSPEEAEAMSRESQFQKAEFKRLERRLKEKVQAAGAVKLSRILVIEPLLFLIPIGACDI